MTRWTLLLIAGTLILTVAVAFAFTAPAQARGEPVRLYHPKTAPKHKLAIIRRVVRHAEHIQAFFEAHPRQARSRAGRAALWRHGRLLKAALREVRKVRRELWLELPDANDWRTASQIAQRPFPGTFSWLMSCSAAEGGHGRWVRYGGGSYYAGYERTDAVGSWLQFRPSTFRAYYARAVATARARGFRVTLPESWLEGWLSPLGVALTGGYMRYFGMDGHHWSASHGRGC